MSSTSLKEKVVHLLIVAIGLISKNTAVATFRLTNAIRLVPLTWVIAYLGKKVAKRNIKQYIDIGTNDGYELKQIVKSIGPFREVHCFEPNQTIAATLKSELKDVHVHAIALGKSSGEAFLSTPIKEGGEHQSRAASIVLDHENNTFGNDVQKVIVKNPRDTTVNWHIPSLIKIDAEGSELEILNELIDIIDENSVVCIEDHWAILDFSEQKAYKASLAHIITRLEDNGVHVLKWM
ncbi:MULTISPECIES: FkbM family methyltransferase [Alteromonadaceae]|uniref:FkbM family methyltransferase n=1 Tax=Brumicola blandensis TaxID=3075611 RepID=A0AAW8R0A5_9ALTE|nr:MULTISPECIES: FkbM family methyltransferase [unclassified Alteromonas]MDT0582702.1 FkbM family methyltransferase [Alteromonas sp. W409]MDT0627749.1 FkbM family methyltransferase [Alteromonas sp. W364]